MLAYLFWHVPHGGIEPSAYEAALLRFHAHLAAAPPDGFAGSATYRISAVPWLDGRAGYEDWCFVTSSAALDGLNAAAVRPDRWDVHAAIAGLTEVGYGGLYHHLHGDERPVAGTRVAWLRRPRGIRFEQPLRDIVAAATGVLGVWRKQMVLGPGDEFAVVGDPTLNVAVPDGWRSMVVERTAVGPDVAP